MTDTVRTGTASEEVCPSGAAWLPAVLLGALQWAAVAEAGWAFSRALPWMVRDAGLSGLSAFDRWVIGSIPFLATYVVMRHVAAPLGRRCDRRLLLTAAPAGVASAEVLVTVTHQPRQLMVLAFVIGALGPAEIWLNGLLADARPLKDDAARLRGTVLGSAFIAFLGLYGVSLPLMAESPAFGWRSWYLASAVTLGGVAIAAPFVLPADVEPSERRGSTAGGRATATDRLEARLSLVNAIGYGVGIGATTLVMDMHGLLAAAWALSLRRLFASFTNLVWKRAATRRPRSGRTEGREQRPGAVLGASLMMLVPWPLWGLVLAGVTPGGLGWGLLGVFAALEAVRVGFFTILMFPRENRSPAAMSVTVAQTVLGIWIGLSAALLLLNLGMRDKALIVVGALFTLATLPLAASLSARYRREGSQKPKPFGEHDVIRLDAATVPVAHVGGETRHFSAGPVRLVDEHGDTLVKVRVLQVRGALWWQREGDAVGGRVFPRTTWVRCGSRWMLVRVAPRVAVRVSGTTVRPVAAAYRGGRPRPVTDWV